MKPETKQLFKLGDTFSIYKKGKKKSEPVTHTAISFVKDGILTDRGETFSLEQIEHIVASGYNGAN